MLELFNFTRAFLMDKFLARATVAVVGIGNWGKNIVRVCRELGVLAGVCDRDEKKTSLFSYEYEVAALTWEEILRDPTITAVAITLPADLHEIYTHQALEAGKHVFVEKPMAMSKLVAKKLSDKAFRSDKILMVGHILQYHNAYIKLRELVSLGTIGAIKYIESTRLHLGPVRKEIGILWELMPHDLSMVLGLATSEVVNTRLTHQNFLNNNTDLNSADVIDVNLEFTNGIKARVYSSWLHPNKEQKFWVVGTKGMLIFDNVQDWQNKLKLVVFNNHSTSTQAVPLVEAEPLKAEMEHFIHCIQHNITAKTDGEEGCRVVKLLEQIAVAVEVEQEELEVV